MLHHRRKPHSVLIIVWVTSVSNICNILCRDFTSSVSWWYICTFHGCNRKLSSCVSKLRMAFIGGVYCCSFTAIVTQPTWTVVRLRVRIRFQYGLYPCFMRSVAWCLSGPSSRTIAGSSPGLTPRRFIIDISSTRMRLPSWSRRGTAQSIATTEPLQCQISYEFDKQAATQTRLWVTWQAHDPTGHAAERT